MSPVTELFDTSLKYGVNSYFSSFNKGSGRQVWKCCKLKVYISYHLMYLCLNKIEVNSQASKDV